MASTTDMPQTFERRAFVRYRRPLESLLGLLGLSPRARVEGQVFDLSSTGIGILLDREYPIEAALILRIPTATKGWCSHLVHVKRCTEVSPGYYQVGCTFVKPLSVAQLQAHLA